MRMNPGGNVRILSGLLIGGVFELVAPSALPCQIRGTVRDEAGAPIAGALVEMWAPLRRVAATATGVDGQFLLLREKGDTARSLLVRLIGFTPARVTISGIDTALTVVLKRLALEAEPVIVRTAPRACPNREDTEARLLWARASARYRLQADTLSYASIVRRSDSRVGPDRIGRVDTLALTWGVRGSAPPFRKDWLRRITATGYRGPLRAGASLDYESTLYPPLEAELSTHFADSVFGRSHRFSYSEGSRQTLVFCPRQARRPEIEGSIVVDDDSSFIEASWRFVGGEGDGDVEAGGQVVFVPAAAEADGPRPLLPVVGIYWRRINAQIYVQRWQEYRSWTYGDPRDLRTLAETLRRER